MKNFKLKFIFTLILINFLEFSGADEEKPGGAVEQKKKEIDPKKLEKQKRVRKIAVKYLKRIDEIDQLIHEYEDRIHTLKNIQPNKAQAELWKLDKLRIKRAKTMKMINKIAQASNKLGLKFEVKESQVNDAENKEKHIKDNTI